MRRPIRLGSMSVALRQVLVLGITIYDVCSLMKTNYIDKNVMKFIYSFQFIFKFFKSMKISREHDYLDFLNS